MKNNERKFTLNKKLLAVCAAVVVLVIMSFRKHDPEELYVNRVGELPVPEKKEKPPRKNLRELFKKN